MLKCRTLSWLHFLAIAIVAQSPQASAQKPPTKLTASYSAAGGQYLTAAVTEGIALASLVTYIENRFCNW